MTKKELHELANEYLSRGSLGYLTVVCNTRTKKVADKCKRLLVQGRCSDALKLGDPIAYNLLINEIGYQNEELHQNNKTRG